MLRKLILLITLLAPSMGVADLGDTYAQSCQEFGGRGFVNKATRTIGWHPRNRSYTVWEGFVKNHCVVMRLIPDKGIIYTIQDAQRILSYNCGRDQLWVAIPSDGDPDFLASWQTSDNELLGSLYSDGVIQIAYTWFIKSQGLLEDIDKAPIEQEPKVDM